MIEIREELPEDGPAVRTVNEEAFGQPEEASVVEKIRANCPDVLSLVALDEGEIVGHILFSPATIETDQGLVEGMGLAPMAVQPDHQRQGIGSALVRRGIDLLAGRACPFVIVLGHQEFYPRFGFERACTYDLQSQWEGVPDEAFLILFFDKRLKTQAGGIARYRDEFDETSDGPPALNQAHPESPAAPMSTPTPLQDRSDNFPIESDGRF